MQHADIGPLYGKLLGKFSSANLLRDAGDRVRRETGNHYLFSTLSGKQWRLLDGDVVELPLLKYANDVHGSGDVANAALIGGRLVALVRIRVLTAPSNRGETFQSQWCVRATPAYPLSTSPLGRSKACGCARQRIHYIACGAPCGALCGADVRHVGLLTGLRCC